MNIFVYMVVRNVSSRRDLFERVVAQGSKVSKKFLIVDHGSTDDTIDIVDRLCLQYQLDTEIVRETFTGTMDEMKGKYYRRLLGQTPPTIRQHVLILDWDEVIDDALADEIVRLDGSMDAYLINRHTYLLGEPIDRNAFLPLLFEVRGVEVGAFKKFHDLYRVRSQRVMKLNSILHHYSWESVEDMFRKNLYYARNEGSDLYEQDPHISRLSVLAFWLWEGLSHAGYTLVYHRNYRSVVGWMYSFSWIMYKYMKYMIYLELQRNK